MGIEQSSKYEVFVGNDIIIYFRNDSQQTNPGFTRIDSDAQYVSALIRDNSHASNLFILFLTICYYMI